MIPLLQRFCLFTIVSPFFALALLLLTGFQAKAQSITNAAYFSGNITLDGDISDFFQADGVTPKPGVCVVNDPNGLDESPLAIASTAVAASEVIGGPSLCPSGFNQRRIMSAYNPALNGGTIFIGIDLPGGTGPDSASLVQHSTAASANPNFFNGVVGRDIITSGSTRGGRGKIVPFDGDANGEADTIGRKRNGTLLDPLFRCSDLGTNTADVIECSAGTAGFTDNPRASSGEALGVRENYVVNIVFDNIQQLGVELSQGGSTTTGNADVGFFSSPTVSFGGVVSTTTGGSGAVLGFDVEMAITNVNNAVPDAFVRRRHTVIVDSGSNRDGPSQGEDQNQIDCTYPLPVGMVLRKQCPPNQVQPGGQLVFTGSISNSGQVTITDLYITNSQPAPNTYLLGPLTLLPGQLLSFTGAYTVPINYTNDTISDTLNAVGTAGPATLFANATAFCSVATPVGMVLRKQCPPNQVQPGGQLVFTGSISNSGLATINNLYITNNQPVPNTYLLGPLTLLPGQLLSFTGAYTVPINYTNNTISDTLNAVGSAGTSTLFANATAFCSVATALAIICPSNRAVECFADIPAPNPGAVTVMGGVSPIVISYVGQTFATNPCAITVDRTYRATDALSNTVSCVQTITLRPRLFDLKILASGAFQFTFNNCSGANYQVLAATDLSNYTLAPSNWTNLGAATPVGGGLYQFTDFNATNFPHRFYQLRCP